MMNFIKLILECVLFKRIRLETNQIKCIMLRNSLVIDEFYVHNTNQNVDFMITEKIQVHSY